MKRFLTCLAFIILLLNFVNSASAEGEAPFKSYKSYDTSSENLYYTVISALCDNNFKVLEMQSENGYILFLSFGKKYLANVVSRGKKRSDLRISPIDGSYKNSFNVINKIFSTVDLLYPAGFVELKYDKSSI